MDNELRKKRVLEGIKLLERDIDPAHYWEVNSNLDKRLGLSIAGINLLYCNDNLTDCKEFFECGFLESGMFDRRTMLHNWKRFYELIKDL